VIPQLTVDQIEALIQSKPEQAVYDWKSDFTIPKDDGQRGELVKDICAIANSVSSAYGFIVYGVDPRRPDPILGISSRYDDARIQQLVADKIEPAVDFVYYEVAAEQGTVAVIQVVADKRRPHIIRVDLGRVRKGQIPIRRGSSTDGVTLADLMEFFYGASSGYFPDVVERLQVGIARQRAHLDVLAELRVQQNDLFKRLEVTAGVPRGSLGAEW